MKDVEEKRGESDHGSVEHGEEDLVGCDRTCPSVQKLGSSENRPTTTSRQVSDSDSISINLRKVDVPDEDQQGRSPKCPQ